MISVDENRACSHGMPGAGRARCPNRFINPVSRADTLERFCAQRIGVPCVKFVELPPDVRPAVRLCDEPDFVVAW
jgi:hypothetical protein